jgi:hypothetical protein
MLGRNTTRLRLSKLDTKYSQMQPTRCYVDKYQKLYVQFELLMMGGGTA